MDPEMPSTSRLIEAVKPLRQSLNQLESALSVVSDSIVILGDSGEVLWCNKSFEHLLGGGLQRLAFTGRELKSLLRDSPGFREASLCFFEHLGEGDGADTLEVAADCGVVRLHKVEWHPVPGSESTVIIFQDIEDAQRLSSLSVLSSELEKESETCSLTGVLNRKGILKKLNHLVDEGFTSSFALLFCDLDSFKEINDVYGHDIGDAVLIRVASVMQHAIRKGDFVGRLAGDEFVVGLVCEPGSNLRPNVVAERILREMDRGLKYARGSESVSLRSKISIGIAFSQDGLSAEDLLRRSDLAMYEAKKIQNKSAYYAYDSILEARQRYNELINDVLFEIAGKGSLQLDLEPIVRGVDLTVAGYEFFPSCTLCGSRPVNPTDLLRAAESSIFLDEYIAALICSIAHASRLHFLEKEQFIYFSISPLCFASDECFSRLESLVGDSGLPLNQVYLGLDEKLFGFQSNDFKKRVGAIRAAGANVILDDFTGSKVLFSEFRSLPIDGVRFSCSSAGFFSQDSGVNSSLQGATSFMSQIGLRVFAKASLDIMVVDSLFEDGVDYVQGFLP